jgi:hypothetical protein
VTGGPPGSVLTPEIIHQAYGADVLVIQHPDTGTPHLIPRRNRPATPDHAADDTTGRSPAQPDTQE